MKRYEIESVFAKKVNRLTKINKKTLKNEYLT